MFLQVSVCPQGGAWSGGRVPGLGGAWSGGVSRPTTKGELEGDLVQAHTQGGSWGDLVQAHTQGGSWGGSGPGPLPRGKLREIWSRPTPKGKVEGDLVQAHSQGGSWGGTGQPPPPHLMATAAGGTHPTAVADPGGPRGPWPPGPVKISHKKDGRQRRPYRFHVSRPPPLPGRWIRYCTGMHSCFQ